MNNGCNKEIDSSNLEVSDFECSIFEDEFDDFYLFFFKCLWDYRELERVVIRFWFKRGF